MIKFFLLSTAILTASDNTSKDPLEPLLPTLTAVTNSQTSLDKQKPVASPLTTVEPVGYKQELAAASSDDQTVLQQKVERLETELRDSRIELEKARAAINRTIHYLEIANHQIAELRQTTQASALSATATNASRELELHLFPYNSLSFGTASSLTEAATTSGDQTVLQQKVERLETELRDSRIELEKARAASNRAIHYLQIANHQIAELRQTTQASALSAIATNPSRESSDIIFFGFMNGHRPPSS